MTNVIMYSENVSKAYGSGKDEFVALNKANIKIYEGEFVAVMGNSGSGKSTLLYVLSGLDSATDGKVFFENKNIYDYSKKEMNEFRRDSIGFVFQGIHLLPTATLYENVTTSGFLGPEDNFKIEERAGKLLELVGLKEQMNRYPSQVSGGQQQRAAIARALINSPKLLFADEPTGALNSTSSNGILNLMTYLNLKGQTIIMVTHDVKAAARAHRVVTIFDGEIATDILMGQYRKEDNADRENYVYSQLAQLGW